MGGSIIAAASLALAVFVASDPVQPKGTETSAGIDVAAVAQLQERMPAALRERTHAPQAGAPDAWATLPDTVDGRVRLTAPGAGSAGRAGWRMLDVPALERIDIAGGAGYVGETWDVVQFVEADRLREYIVVNEHQGRRTWRWQLYAATPGHEIEVLTDGRIDLGSGFHLDPPKLLDAELATIDRDVAWRLDGSVLELSFDDAGLELPYVIDPDATPPSLSFLGWIESSPYIHYNAADDPLRLWFKRGPAAGSATARVMATDLESNVQHVTWGGASPVFANWSPTASLIDPNLPISPSYTAERVYSFVSNANNATINVTATNGEGGESTPVTLSLRSDNVKPVLDGSYDPYTSVYIQNPGWSTNGNNRLYFPPSSAFSDAGASAPGVGPITRLVQRRDGVADGFGGCNTGGNPWITVATDPTGTNINNGVVMVPGESVCSEFQYVIQDAVGNELILEASGFKGWDDTDATVAVTSIVPGTNPQHQHVEGANTIYINGNETGSFTINAQPFDGGSGVAYVEWEDTDANGNGWSPFGSRVRIDEPGPFSSTYTFTGPGVSNLSGESMYTRDWAGNTATIGNAYYVYSDVTGPVRNGSYLSYGATPWWVSDDQGQIEVDFAGAMSDASSGIASYQLQREVAAWDPVNSCSVAVFSGVYTNVGAPTTPPTTPASYIDTDIDHGFCYRYRVMATDNVGNVGYVWGHTTSGSLTPPTSTQRRMADFVYPTATLDTLPAATSGYQMLSGTNFDDMSGVRYVRMRYEDLSDPGNYVDIYTDTTVTTGWSRNWNTAGLNGNFRIHIDVEDWAGNLVESIVTHDIAIDNELPTLTFDNFTQGTNPQYSQIDPVAANERIWVKTTEGASGSLTVHVTPSALISGVAAVQFEGGPAGWTPAYADSAWHDVTSGPWQFEYTWTDGSSAFGGSDATARTVSNGGRTQTPVTRFNIERDNTLPTGGSISYPTGWSSLDPFPITLSHESDAASGMREAQLVRDRAPRVMPSCAASAWEGTFSHVVDSWSVAVDGPESTWDTNILDNDVDHGYCYRYRLISTDNVSNTRTRQYGGGDGSAVALDLTMPIITTTLLDGDVIRGNYDITGWADDGLAGPNSLFPGGAVVGHWESLDDPGTLVQFDTAGVNATSGNWLLDFNYTDTLDDGHYRIHIDIRDSAGNAMASILTREVIIDNSPPEVDLLSFDLGGPLACQHWSGLPSTTVFFNPQTPECTGGEFTVNATATDEPGGINYVEFPYTDPTNRGVIPDAADGRDYAAPYSMRYVYAETASDPNTERIRAYGLSGAVSPTSMGNIRLQRDTTNPNGFSFGTDPNNSHPGGTSAADYWWNDDTPSVGFNIGDDANVAAGTGSGLREYRLERRAAPRAGNNCNGTWGPWEQVVGSVNAPVPFEDADAPLAGDTCYQYRGAAVDNVSNETFFTSSRHIRVDVTPPTGTFDAVAPVVKGNVALSGTRSDDWSNIASTEVQVDGVTAPGCTLTGTGLNWSCTWDSTLTPDGPATVAFVLTDRAGNVFDTLSYAVVVDNTPPTGTVTLAEGSGDEYTHLVPGTPDRIYVNTNDGTSGSFTATLTADDGAGTGLTYATFATIGAGWLPNPTTQLTLPFEQTYTWTGGSGTFKPAAPGTHQVQFEDAAVNQTTADYEVIADDDAATGAGIDYDSEPVASANVTLTAGTDAGSGLASWEIERRETAVTGPGTCATGSWSAWTSMGPATPGAAPATYADGTLVMDTCYQYRIIVTDNVGNSITVGDAEDDTITVEPAGVVVEESAGTTEVAEGGATDTYTVRLRTKPTSDVTITITDDAQVSASAATLTFTPANWNTNQTVTVTAVQDDIEEVDVPHFGTITHAATSSDTDYGGISVAQVNVTVTDDDEHGITVTPAAPSLSVDEAALTTPDTYTIVLDSEPTGNVTIDLADTNGEIDIAPAQLVFTPGNWDTAQTISVTARDDQRVEADPHPDLVVHSISSSDAMYNDETIADVPVQVADDDVAGVTVTPASGLELAEKAVDGDTSVTFTVALTSEPADTVTINLVGDADGDVSPTSLTFGPGDWQTGKTVTVDVVDDLIVEGPHTTTVSFLVVSPLDSNYDAFPVAPQVIDVIDDDVPGIEVNPLTGLTATEGGAGDTYEIRLMSQPVDDVTITFVNDDGELAPITPLVFTSADYDWQTVTVAAEDDAVDELTDPHYGTIRHEITSPTDTVYPALNIADQIVEITDNDDAGITIDEDDGVEVDEADLLATDSFTIVLDSAPTQPVNITATANAPAQVVLTNATHTFDAANWNIPHEVFVAAADDAIAEADPHPGDITVAIDSADPKYGAVPDATVTAQVADDDIASVTVQAGTLALDEEGEPVQSYDISIGSEPLTSVMVSVTSDTQLETDVTSVTFTPGNWSTPQTVQVNAVDDDIVEGPHGGTITHAVTAGDPAYMALTPLADKLATITDNDNPGISVNELDGVTVYEDGSVPNDSYEIVLDKAPQQNVVVDISVDAQVNVAPAQLTFTPGNWDTPQPVTVTAEDDNVQEAPIHPGEITHAVSSSDPLWASITTAAPVTANVHDDDVAAVIINQTGPYDLSEDDPAPGTTVTYSVVLDTIPTDDVEVTVHPPADLLVTDPSVPVGDPIVLTFTPATWNVAQTVEFGAVNDLVTEAPIHVRTITHTVASDDTFYAAVTIDDVVANITDNDIPGILVTPTTLDVTEGGAGASFDVSLLTEPTDVVRITFTNTQVETDVPYVEFAPGNWATQTVNVTATDDAIDEHPDTHAGLVELAATSATDLVYDGWTPLDDVAVNITDNDTAGIAVTPGTTPIVVDEQGATTQQYTVTLTSEPTAPVTVAMSSTNGQVTVSPASVEIQPGDWVTPVSIDVTAIDDPYDEAATHTDLIAHTVTSGDAKYQGLGIDGQAVEILDNDDSSITVTPTLVPLDEDDVATTGTVNVRLGSEPLNPVTVSFGTADGQSVTSVPSVILDATNWALGEDVTVTVVDDEVAEGSPHAGLIELTASSTVGDPYDSIDPDDVTLEIQDNDTAGIIVTETGTPTASTDVDEAGATDTYTITLNSRPTHPVTINITTPGDQATVDKPSITIQPAGWATGEVITVTGTPDAVIEGLHTQTIEHVATSTDPNYEGAPVANVTANITDDDVAGVTIDPTALATAEGDTDGVEYQIELTAQPSAPVTVTLHPDAQVSTDAPSNEVVFTSGDWDQPQTVTVTAVDDLVVEGEHPGNITHTVASTDGDFAAISAISDVTVTITDNDIPSVILDTNDVAVVEGGAPETVNVTLGSYPTADVDVTFVETLPGGQLTPITTLTIPRDDWNVPHPVSIEAFDDLIAEGTHGATVQVDTASGDSYYTTGSLTIAPVNVTITDNDTAGIVLLPASGLAGAEGDTVPYTMQLNSEPTADVEVTLTGDADGTPQQTTYTFTSGAWGPQPVNVDLVQDFIAEGAHTTTITGAVTNTTDVMYTALVAPDQVIDIADDDSASVTFTPTTPGPLPIAEGGATATYSIKLGSEPTDPVRIDFGSVGGQASMSPAFVEIDAANWMDTHDVVVTAVDDAVTEGAHVDSITHTISGDDTVYTALTLPAMDLEIADNDDPAVLLVPTDTTTDVTEGGATDTVQLSLGTKPLTAVTLTLTGTQVSLAPDVITIQPDDWNTPVDVTVTAIDDAIAEGAHLGSIDAVASGDPLYDGTLAPTHVVQITDNDNAGVIITQPAAVALDEANPTASQTYQVRLSSEPTADVTVLIQTADGQTAVDAPLNELTFTPANWMDDQDVVVTPVDDALAEDTPHDGLVTHDTASSDAGYGTGVLTIDAVLFQIADDDTPEVVISNVGPFDLDEDQTLTETYNIALKTQPTDPVTVTPDSTQLEWTVPSVELNAGNWELGVDVTIQAIDDEVDEDDPHPGTLAHVFASDDDDYAGIASDDVTASIADNDTSDLVLAPDAGLTVDEEGDLGPATYVVTLTSIPQAPVTVDLGFDAAQLGVSPAQVTLTDTNWNTGETITVTAFDDDVAEAATHASVITHAMTSADPNFGGETGPEQSVDIVDNDVAGVVVEHTDGSTDVHEDGSVTDEISIRLSSKPTGPVDVTISSPDSQVETSPTVITIQPDDWDSAVLVPVTAVQDFVIEGLIHTGTLAFETTSTDPNYVIAPGTIADLLANVTDDDVAGINVVADGGAFEVAEGGTTDTLTYTLTSIPSDPVIIDLTTPDGELTVAPTSITLDASNWDTGAQVVVTAFDDPYIEGGHTGEVVHVVTTGDTNYQSITVPNQTAQITDNDSADVIVTIATPLELDEADLGQTAEFTVELGAAPAPGETVTVTPLHADGQLTIAPASHTFTDADWNQPKTVTLTVEDDPIDEADPHTGTVTFDVTSNDTDSPFHELPVASVDASIIDNDTSGIVLDQTSVTVHEDGSSPVTVKVKLNSQPLGDIEVTVTGDAQASASTTPAPLVFTPTNWMDEQDIVIDGIQDPIDEADPHQAVVTLAAMSVGASDANYDGLADATIDVAVNDDDTSEILVTPQVANPTELDEADDTVRALYDIVLATQPSHDVTVTFALDAQLETDVASLTFTPANWSTAQTVEVFAHDDAIDEASPHSGQLGFAVASDDVLYAALLLPNQLIDVLDDDAAGVLVDMDPAPGPLDEAGTLPPVSYELSLESEPTDDAVITLATDAQVEIDGGVTELTFTPADWDQPQGVTVTAVDDLVSETTPHAGIVAHMAASDDANYGATLDIDDAEFAIDDDDVAGFTLTPDPMVVEVAEEAETSATYTLAIDALPANPVTVNFAHADGQVTVSPASHTFSATAMDPVTITVTAVDDNFVEAASHPATITHEVDASSDPVYLALGATAIDDVVAQVADNDEAGVLIDEVDGISVAEAGETSDSFWISLTAQPLEPVTINFDGGTQLQDMSGSSITIQPVDWATPVSISVTAKDDFITEDTPHDGPIDITTASDDTNFAGLTIPNVIAKIDDDDVPEIEIDPAASLDLAEADAAGTEQRIRFRLKAQPVGTVTITATPDSQLELMGLSTLTFTPADWSTYQEIVVRAFDDAIDDDATHDGVVSFLVAGDDDPLYAAIALAPVTFNVADNDTAGITYTPDAANPTETAEADDTIHMRYGIVLQSQPTHDVTIAVNIDGQLEADATELTFTPANWSIEQFVEVWAHDDAIAETPTHTGTLSYAITSDDAAYAAMSIADETISILDDDTPGVIIDMVPTPSPLDEAGTLPAVTYSVSLQSQPTDPVTITLAPDAQVAVDGGITTLTFTDADWDQPQTVTVTAVDDLVSETTPHAGLVVHTAASDDANYGAALDIDDAEFAIDDDDVAGFTLTPDPMVVEVAEEGATSATYTLAIDTLPGAPVTVNFAHADGEVTVSPASHTFSATAMDPVTITVTAVDDDFVETATHPATITNTMDPSSDPVYLALGATAIADVVAQVTDNDEAGVIVDELDGISVAEAGETTDTFTVQLKARPTQDVTISFAGGTELKDMSGETVVIAADDDWALPRTITVQANDDFITEPNPHDAPIVITTSSTDTDFDALDVDDVIAKIADDDIPQINVTPPASLNMDEADVAGTEQRIGFAITTQPVGDITIAATVDPQLEIVGDAQVVFTPTDWMGVREIVVRAKDDAIAELPLHDGIISFAVTAPDDVLYSVLPVDPVTFSIADNDTAGITYTPDAANPTEVAEADDTIRMRYGVVLTSEPTDTVTIAVNIDGQLEADATELTFTAADWMTEQFVEVWAKDDAIDEAATHTGTLSYAITSGDATYGAMTIPDEMISILDDDTAGVVITQTPTPGQLDEEGDLGPATYTVELQSEPTEPVSVTLAPDAQVAIDGGVTQLEFTPADWADEQTVTVTAVDDLVSETSPHAGAIAHATISDDPSYAPGLVVDDAAFEIADNDDPGFTFTPAPPVVDIAEEGATSATYELAIDTLPGSPVTVNFAHADGQVSVSPASHTFSDTAMDPVTITVTAIDDPNIEAASHPATVTHVIDPASDPVYLALEPGAIDDVVANITDNDEAGVVVDTSAGLDIAEEGETTATFTVQLTARPTDPVTISFDGGTQLQDMAAQTLVIQPDDWASPATISATAFDDPITEDAIHDGPITITTTSDDTNFDALDVDDVVTKIADNDVPEVEIVPAASLDLTEADAAGTEQKVGMRLKAQPVGTVTIDATADAQLDVTGGPLTFTPTDWNTVKELTIRANDDAIAEAPLHDGVLSFAITAGDDPLYAAIVIDPVTFSITDNDTAAFTVTPDAANPTEVAEADDTVRMRYGIVLTSEPTDNVTITFNLDGQLESDAPTLEFTPANWMTEQFVEVWALDDDIAELPTHQATLGMAVTTDDATYAAIALADTVIDVLDDDVAGVVIEQDPTPGLLDEEGDLGPSTYTVALSSQPANDVTVTLAPDAQVEITGAVTELTFTPATWADAQSVEVTAIDDLISEATHPGAVVHDTVSDDPAYAAGVLTIADGAFSIEDNDDAGFELTPAAPALSVAEEGETTATYELAITSIPSDPVTVNFTDADGQVTITPASHTFSATAMDPVEITVAAIDDPNVESATHNATIVHEIDASSAAAYLALGAGAIADVPVEITDNDSAGVEVNTADGVSVLEEGETSGTFTVQLTARPTDPVTINFDGGTQLQDMSGASITIAPDDWNAPQTVSVTAVDDSITELEIHDAPVAITTTSDDAAFHELDVDDVIVQVTDNDAPSIEIVPPASLDVEEADSVGTQRIIGIRLGAQPVGDVVVIADSGDQLLLDGTDRVTINASNWTDTHELIIRAWDDSIAEAASHEGAVTFRVESPTDPGYETLTIDPLVFSIADDDYLNAVIECAPGPNWSLNGDGKVDVAEDPDMGNHTVSCYLGIGVAVADDVTINVTVADPTQLHADTLSVMIPAGSTTAQLDSFSAVDDAIAEASPLDVEVSFEIVTDSPVYSAMTIDPVTFAITDDDVAALIVTPTTPLTVTEGGDAATFDVRLATEPTANVTVTLFGDLQSSPNATELTFTPANWDQPQLVTVTATDDAIDEPDGHPSEITIGTSSTDLAYDGLTVDTVSVLVNDNDQARLVVTASGGSSTVAEGGASTELSLALATIPSDTVTVTVTPDSQLSVGNDTYTFTPANWSTPQTVAVSAVQDLAIEGDHNGNISFSLASNDIAYGTGSAATPGAHSVAITDDDVAGVKIVQTDGTTVLAETGGTDTYTIQLAGQPTADVIVTPNGGTQVAVEPASLTFTPANWNQPQTVTVRAIQDAIDEADPHPGEIKHELTTTAAGWNGVNADSVVAQITDDDTANVIVTETGGNTAVREGDKTGDTISFRLASKPTKPVNIYATNSDQQLTVPSEAIVLNESNWDQPVTMNVVAVDDDEPEDMHTGSLSFKLDSEDEIYAKVSISGITVAITDNDSDEDVIIDDEDEDEKAKKPRVTIPPATTRPGRDSGKQPAPATRRSTAGSNRTDAGKKRAGTGLDAPVTGGTKKQQEDLKDTKAAARANDTIEEREDALKKGPLSDLLKWLAANWKLWLPLAALGAMVAGAGMYMLRSDPIKAAQRTGSGKAASKIAASKASAKDKQRKLRGGRRRKKQDDEDEQQPPRRPGGRRPR